MSKLTELKAAIELLENQDIDALKHALELVGEPVTNAPSQSGDLPFEIGKQYLVRTVTYFQVGRLVEIRGVFLVLADASWISDTGRFADTLKSGDFDEIEPVGTAIVNTAAIIDAFPFTADLPKDQK